MTEFNITFPCSVGDEVWCISPRKEVRKEKVDRLVILSDAVFCVTDRGVYYVQNEIYATEKEAREALR
jgi:hypothetical protein